MEPFEILYSNFGTENLNLEGHEHIELHLEEERALIVAAIRSLAIVYQVDLSEGIDQAKIVKKARFPSSYFNETDMFKTSHSFLNVMAPA